MFLLGREKKLTFLSFSRSFPSHYPLQKNPGHLPLGPDEIEAKGIRLQGAPVYLDAQVRIDVFFRSSCFVIKKNSCFMFCVVSKTFRSS